MRSGTTALLPSPRTDSAARFCELARRPPNLSPNLASRRANRSPNRSDGAKDPRAGSGADADFRRRRGGDPAARLEESAEGGAQLAFGAVEAVEHADPPDEAVQVVFEAEADGAEHLEAVLRRRRACGRGQCLRRERSCTRGRTASSPRSPPPRPGVRRTRRPGGASPPGTRRWAGRTARGPSRSPWRARAWRRSRRGVRARAPVGRRVPPHRRPRLRARPRRRPRRPPRTRTRPSAGSMPTTGAQPSTAPTTRHEAPVGNQRKGCVATSTDHECVDGVPGCRARRRGSEPRGCANA